MPSDNLYYSNIFQPKAVPENKMTNLQPILYVAMVNDANEALKGGICKIKGELELTAVIN